MSTPITFNSVAYSVPAYNDTGYAQGAGNLSSYLIAISTGTLQQSGGTFTLTADVNFGPNFGLVAKYYTSATSTPATAGAVRLANADLIEWRNFGLSGNNILGVDSSDNLVYNGNTVLTSSGGGFVSSITGTTNEVIASSPTGAVTLSLPQAIATSSTVRFGKVGIGQAATNQLDVTGSVGVIATSSTGSGTEMFGLSTTGLMHLGNSTAANTLSLKNQSAIEFQDAAQANVVSLKAPATYSAGYSLLLPTAQGASNSFLKNDGSGNLSFAAASGNFVSSITGTANQIIASASTGAITLSAPQNIGTASDVTFNSVTWGSGNVGNLGVSSGIASVNGNGLRLRDTSGSSGIIIDGTMLPVTAAAVSIGSNSLPFNSLFLKGNLQLNGATSGNVTLAANAITTSYSLSMPNAQSSGTTFLQNDGSGNLSWVSSSGSGTVTSGTAGNLTLYNASTNTVTDTYVQNTKNINIAIAAQAARSANLVYTFPNPGNAVTTATVDLLETAQTISGVKTFSAGAGAITMSSSTIAMGANKITGLAAASTAGDALRYEQLFNASTVTLLGSLAFNPTTAGIVGTTTNDNTSAGNVGEYVESIYTNTSFGANGVAADITTITLSAGDWDVTINGNIGNSGATITGNLLVGISVTAGNSLTGLVTGVNQWIIGVVALSQLPNYCIANYRMSLSGSTVVRVKSYADYTSTAPTTTGIIRARRRR